MTGVAAVGPFAADEVVRVDLWHVAVPLRNAFEASHGTEEQRAVVVVRCTAADGAVGWGECDALAQPTYTHEYTRGAFILLRDALVPALLAGAPPAHRHHPMARSALATALLDGGLRRAGRRLADHLAGTGPAPAERLERTVVLGRIPLVADLLGAVERAVDAGAARVKLKVASPADLATCAVVRQVFPALRLAADANGALAGSSAQDLLAAGLDELRLDELEQPYPADDLLASAALQARCATPIALDESITSLATLRTAHALRALNVVNVKPARLGGPCEAAAMAAWAVGEGLGVFVGGMLELGVGRAMATAVAAGGRTTLPTDVGPSAQYVLDDLTEPLVCDPVGRVVVPSGSGIGVQPRASRLAETCVEHAALERSVRVR